MKRVLFDVNVILDAILQRAPFVGNAERLWAMAEARTIHAYVSAHSVTTVFYLLRKALGANDATRAVTLLLRVFSVAPVNESVVRKALAFSFSDFEDAVCVAAAMAARCDLVVTRDSSGFARAPIDVLEPGAALALVSKKAHARKRRRKASKA